MNAPVSQVLSVYPSPLRGRVESLGNRGGFSGACVWRVQTPVGMLCLRAGAPSETREHVIWRHGLMKLARDAALGYVPRVMATTNGERVVELSGREWELMEWMPGRATYREAPSTEKLRNAAQALARMHRAWEPLGGEVAGPCPAVQRRLETALVPLSPLGRGVRGEGFGVEREMMTQLQALVSRWLPRVPNLLRGAHIACRLQPCLRDIHHEHLLYDGDTLTGLIDYASAGQDSVAVDVARMLGSLIEDDDVRWQVALSAYRDVRAFTMAEEELARGLDRAGVIVAMANWWRWMVERDEVEIQGHVLRRVQELVARVERW